MHDTFYLSGHSDTDSGDNLATLQRAEDLGNESRRGEVLLFNE